MSARLSRGSGPARIGTGGVWVEIGRAPVVSRFRTTTIAIGGAHVATVEHLYAALAGLGVRDGVDVEVSGGALPLLDGGAARFADTIAALEPPTSRPALRVVKDAALALDGARATFARANATTVRARLVGMGSALDADAVWHGGAEEFRERIAPARTFLVADDADAMLAAGMSFGVSPDSVVVVDREGGIFATGKVARDEPARHKLLDLIGDLYAWGGPPIGEVLVERPGHAINHAIVERALAEGILAPS